MHELSRSRINNKATVKQLRKDHLIFFEIIYLFNQHIISWFIICLHVYLIVLYDDLMGMYFIILLLNVITIIMVLFEQVRKICVLFSFLTHVWYSNWEYYTRTVQIGG